MAAMAQLLALLSLSPAGLISEGYATSVFPLGSTLFQALPHMRAQRFAIVLSEGPQHLGEEHTLRPGVVDVLHDRHQANIMPGKDTQ